MSLIFETKTLTTPGVYTFTIPSGVGDIEVHLWGGGGGDGASGKNRTVVLNPGRAEQSTASGSRTYTSGQGVFTVPDLVTSISVSVVGGGGGGGNYHKGCSSKTPHYGGNGGGGFVTSQTLTVSPGQQISYSVGAGGSAPGGSGSGSSFGSVSAGGGNGGATGTGNGPGANGSGGSGGNGGAGGKHRDDDPTGKSGGSGRITVSWQGVVIPEVPRVTETIVGSSGGKGAGGGYSYTKVRVRPGDVITVAVGKRGNNAGAGGASLTTPTNYGGGSGASGSNSDGGGGGGATVVLVNNVVVAVAGGGGGGGAGGTPGFSLNETSTTTSTPGSQSYNAPGVYTWTVPAGVTSVNVDLIGAGGGGGGSDDARTGAAGSAGGKVTGSIPVSPGDVLTLGIGQGGRPAGSNTKSAGGGAGGESLNGQYAGGRGGNAGGSGTSGGGGGGGGATVVLRNGVAVAVAHGGGGGGGAGVSSNGQAAIQSTVGTTSGSAGQDKSGDGGGGGGGGGGASGGAGGVTLSGDVGARTGSDGTDLVPAGGTSATGAAGGGTAAVGSDGRAQLSWTATFTVPGTALITVDPNGSSIGGNGLPATNIGFGYGIQGLGQSSASGSSSGGGGGGGFYGGVSGVSGNLGGGGQGGTNFGNLVLAGSGTVAGGKNVTVYPGPSAGDRTFDGAAIINFIKSFTFNVKKENKWRLVDQGWVKVNGVWKMIYNGYVKQNGQWYLINSNPVVNLPSGTYSLNANVASVNEGAAVRVTLVTSGVAAGTVVPYGAFGIPQSQLQVGSLSGSFTVGTNDFVDFVPIIDNTTTGNKTLTIELTDKNIRTAVTIIDTTFTPSGFLLANVGGVNEGSAVRITLNTFNVSAGTVIPYTVSGITQADLTAGSLSGNFVVGSSDFAEFAFANDFSVNEGNKVLVLRTSGALSLTETVNVIDTSVYPTGTAVFPVGNSTWTVPAGVTRIRITGYGGGGAGGSGDGGKNNEGPGYGGGGSNLIKQAFSVTPGTSINVSVGAGGTGGYGQRGLAGRPTTASGTGVSFTAAGGGGGGSRDGWGPTGEVSPGVYDTVNRGGAGANGAGSGGRPTAGLSTNGGANGGTGGPYNMQGGASGQDGYMLIEWGPSIGR